MTKSRFVRQSDPIKIAPRRRWTIYTIALGLWGSGAMWLLFHYFFMRQTEFGLSPHPLEHWWLALHGLFGFAALWAFGFLWGVHIIGAWKTGRHRISGSVLTALVLLLAASGYLLYYLGDDRWLPSVSVLHWVIGLAMPMPFLMHRFTKAIRARAHHVFNGAAIRSRVA